METRKEKDALGPVEVPVDRYYGAQTQRAKDNFRIGHHYFPQAWIQSHAMVKKAAAAVNCQLGLLPEDVAKAIDQAADEVIAGKFDEHFPLKIWQSGSGTQFNMNVNEVIANRGIEIMGGTIGTKKPVHPNDHVNMAQSTNDTIPVSMHVASVIALKEKLLPAVEALRADLQAKADSWQDIVKIGRTHLQDATPLTLGQEFSGYADQLRLAIDAINDVVPKLCEIPIGGTAVGTGLNTKVGYDTGVAAKLSEITGHPFVVARNKYANMAAHDVIALASGALKMLAAALMKIANDIRWLGSGPRCGLGEINMPANEPGSSIMPGKVNPTQCEMVTMVVCQVYGNDTTISMAASQGNFELNVFKPILGYAILDSITILADSCNSFLENCIVGVEPNRDRIDQLLNESLMLVTSLNKHIGYDKAAEIALKAWREGLTLKQSALALDYVNDEQFQQWVRPETMIAPNK